MRNGVQSRMATDLKERKPKEDTKVSLRSGKVNWCRQPLLKTLGSRSSSTFCWLSSDSSTSKTRAPDARFRSYSVITGAEWFNDESGNISCYQRYPALDTPVSSRYQRHHRVKSAMFMRSLSLSAFLFHSKSILLPRFLCLREFSSSVKFLVSVLVPSKQFHWCC